MNLTRTAGTAARVAGGAAGAFLASRWLLSRHLHSDTDTLYALAHDDLYEPYEPARRRATLTAPRGLTPAR
jgi:hypothetical protein